MTMVNMKQRYVASTTCPIGKSAQLECVALGGRVFDDDVAAAAALVAHLASAEGHTREQLARIVGGAPAYTRSFRLVYENHVWDGLAA